MPNPTYLTPKEAAKVLGVHVKTLREWELKGKIKAIKTPSGQRRYDVESYQQKYEKTSEKAGRVGIPRATITYARVSSRSQKADLDRQVAVLVNLYPDSETITDIGSGLNFRRKGLITLLERVCRGDIQRIVVAHKDRLCRFGFDLIKWLCERNGCEVVVLSQDNLSPERELVEDILAIIHIFSCRLYGLRKYKQQVKEDQEIQNIKPS
jgi:excisionase family DNA binding protein